jgi:PAS domain S-box-containing protein
MKRTIRVLIVEDNPADAELVVRELHRAGFDPQWQRVDTEAEFLDRLHPDLDIILSDYSMPQFDGLRALELLKQGGRDVPFIFISGTLGEEKAVEAMKQGVTDYLLKDRITRLGNAVERALEQKRLRDERKRMQQQLLLQSTAVEAAGNAILVTNRSGAILLANPAFTALTGYTAEEVLGKTPRVLKSGKHDQAFYRKLWKTILSGQTWRGEFTNRRKDGSLFYDEHTITPVRSEGGEITHFIGIMHDVTKRNRVEERVQEQARMLDQAHDAIIVCDIHTGQITFWNQGAERLYGWAAAEAVGRDIGKLIFADPSALEAVTEQLLKTGEWHGEHRHVSKAGEKLTVSSHVTLVRDADGHPKSALVINIDITEQKDLEARFLRAQRMESIGTLASGVAHDLNNILAPILMGAAVLRRTEMPEADEAILSTIETCAQRGADIVKQVLTFARGAEGARLLLQPAHLINDMAKIAEETFPKTITVRTGFSQSLWPIEGDPTQLHQVLLNLSVNARDAMPNGGTLTLSAENFPVDEHYASMTPGAKAGPHVLFEVIDMGMGISREVIDKIFDPFFTTKEIGHGTGLGLSTVIGIVKNHGGFVSVYSEIGRGTTFKVFLPAKVGELAGVEQSVTPALPPANGELLLIVDDEEPILQVARALLEGHGYQVLTAGDAPEALAIFAMRKDEIKLVLADLAMPLMDGIALIRTLKKMKPDVKVIASTGQGCEGVHANDLEALNVGACLTKPYNKDKLLTTLHDALNPQTDKP